MVELYFRLNWKVDMEKLIERYLNSSRFRDFFEIKKDESVDFEMLAQGEYNINYKIKHKNFAEAVFRINTASQLNLENQISYEYLTLNSVKASKRTPIPMYLDDNKDLIPYGVLVMNFIKGAALDYKKDLKKAACCLADIHSLDTGKAHLIVAKNPKSVIVNESEGLIDKYLSSSYSNAKIGRLLEKVYEKTSNISDLNLISDYKTLINTELNSGNFLIDKDCMLVDWEKAIYGDVAQDLGHFLAPTTTFWKTDIFLDNAEKKLFVEDYIKSVDNRFKLDNIYERTMLCVSINCLRGLSWCAMAYTEYQGERTIKNEFTYNKIKEYVSVDFIEKILRENF